MFFLLRCSLRFLIVLGSILVPFWPPKWSPGGAAELVLIDWWAVQDGLGIVLVRSFFRLAVWARFFNPLGLLLGSSWVAFGSVLVPIWPPKWCPRGDTKLGFGGPLGVQDGLEIVLVRFSCRLVVRDRFFCPLGLVLGSFWGAHGVVLVLWGAS